MKKIFVSIIALLAVSFGLSAQQQVKFSEDINVSYGNKVFVVRPVSYLGYGYHLKSQDMRDEQNAFNSEFFVNIMELAVRPASWMSINLGVDYDLDQYRLDKNHLWGAEDNGSVWIRSSENYKGIKYSRLNVHTFSIPLSLEFAAGKAAFRLGAAGEYNLPATVKNKVVTDEGTSKYKAKGLPTKSLNYSFFGAISYGGLGVYVRYRPVYQFEEKKGPQFTTLTIGAVLGLGF